MNLMIKPKAAYMKEKLVETCWFIVKMIIVTAALLMIAVFFTHW